MLDAEGQLYITDFGLARIETDVGVTMTGDLVGTLRYMSPEQVLAKRIVIDHRSDIYSLGVTLYELLTLRPPFDGENRQELLKQIAFEDPPKPCQISRSIPRELETIILKAIEKNPDERYATAEELSEDLQAFLEDRPTKAKPPTLLQRSAKWSRRHKPLVWSASLSVAFLMVAGLVLLAISNLVITEERNQKAAALTQRTAALSEKDDALATADKNFEKALEAVDQMLARVATDSLRDVPQMTPVKAELLEDALTFYETLLEQDPENLTVRYRMAEAQGSLGEVLKMLDRKIEAEAMFNAAIVTLDDLVDESPLDRMYQRRLAFSYNRFGWLLGRTRVQESEDAHRSAAAIYEGLLEVPPEVPVVRWHLAHSYQSIANDLEWQNQLDAAEMFARQAIGLFDASDTAVGNIHAAAHLALAQILQKQGDHKQADTAYVNAIQIRREYLRDEPPHASEQHFLAEILLRHGRLLRQLQRYDQAQQCYTEAYDIWSILEKSYPNAPAYSNNLSGARRSLVALLNSTGQTAAANQLVVDMNPRTAEEYVQRAKLFEQHNELANALADYVKAIELDPNNAELQHRVSVSLRFSHGEPNDALIYAKKAVELAPHVALYHSTLGRIYWDALRDRNLALKSLDRAIELDPKLVSAYIDRQWVYRWFDPLRGLEEINKALQLDPENAVAHRSRGEIYGEIDRLEEALVDFNKSQRLNPHNRDVYHVRGGLYLKLHQHEAALDDFNKAIELTPYYSYTYKRRGLTHFHLSHYEEALADIATALELNPKDLSCLTWIDTGHIANCPNEEFRTGMRALLDRGVAMTDRSVASLTARAQLLIAFGEWEQARKDLDAVVAAKDAAYYPLYQVALLSVAGDDMPRYGELCLRMLAAFADSDVPIETHFTAWSCALAPDAIDDYAAAIKLARQAVEKEPDSQQYLNGLGAILMRSGQHAAAKIELDKALAATESGKTSSGYVRYFLAMTEHHLGHQQAAKDQLDTANRSAEQELAESPRWNRTLTLELLRSEAEALIGEAKASLDANANTSADPAPPASETADE